MTPAGTTIVFVTHDQGEALTMSDRLAVMKEGTIEQVESICSQVSGQVEPAFIPDCGHRPHHQCPEMALPRMREFIRRIS